SHGVDGKLVFPRLVANRFRIQHLWRADCARWDRLDASVRDIHERNSQWHRRLDRAFARLLPRSMRRRVARLRPYLHAAIRYQRRRAGRTDRGSRYLDDASASHRVGWPGIRVRDDDPLPGRRTVRASRAMDARRWNLARVELERS